MDNSEATGKIHIEELKKLTKSNFPKGFKVLKHVINHLKIHKYKIIYEEFGKEIVFVANREQGPSFIIVYVKHGFLFSARFAFDKNKFKNNQEEIYKIINEMNRIPDIVSFTADKGDFVVVAWYPDYYTKSTFDDFLEMISQSVSMALRKNDNFFNFLKSEN